MLLHGSRDPATHPYCSTGGGLHAGDDGVSYTAPSAMWVKAFDMVLTKLKETGFPFAKVAAISGCGQVHIFHIIRAVN